MTVQADRKVPDIRFHKFEATWSRYSLAEAANFRRGSFPQPYGLKEWYDGPDAMPFVQVIDVTKELSLAAKTKQRISKIAQFKSVFVEKGSVVVTLQGSIGRVAILPYDAYIDRTLLIFKEYTYKTNTHFWAYLIQKVFDTEKQRAPGGIIKTITKEALSKFQIFTPVFEEQTQIGNYFQNLDSLINQHQHKHDTLLTLKIAMLQKMFPQAGATTPEIRFGEFSGDWIEKRLDEISEIVGGGTPSTSIQEYWGGDIDWYSPTEIGDDVYAVGSVKKITSLGFTKSSARLLPPFKTVLFTSRAGIGGMAILMKEGCTNQGFQSIVLDDETDPYFIYSMGHLIKIHALKHASGSTFLEVSSKQLGKMIIRTPEKDEQQKIGSYFRTLDELISQHATLLQKLKQIKSACLEKMFV